MSEFFEYSEYSDNLKEKKKKKGKVSFSLNFCHCHFLTFGLCFL